MPGTRRGRYASAASRKGRTRKKEEKATSPPKASHSQRRCRQRRCRPPRVTASRRRGVRTTGRSLPRASPTAGGYRSRRTGPGPRPSRASPPGMPDRRGPAGPSGPLAPTGARACRGRRSHARRTGRTGKPPPGRITRHALGERYRPAARNSSGRPTGSKPRDRSPEMIAGRAVALWETVWSRTMLPGPASASTSDTMEETPGERQS